MTTCDVCGHAGRSCPRIDAELLCGDTAPGTALCYLRGFERLRAENAALRAEIATYRDSLAVLAEHEPSWSDDFCRARAALGRLRAVGGER